MYRFPKSLKRTLLKLVIFSSITFFALNFFGVFDHVYEINYHNFSYPLVGDVYKYATQLRNGQVSDKSPINIYNYTYKWNPASKCKTDGRIQEIKLIFLVKSATENFKNRDGIRNSWGFEKRFSDVEIRTVFLLGKPKRPEIQQLIDIEAQHYEDIVLADFEDTYFNNTIKTMMGFRWVIENCPKSKFYMFVDDDYYISVKNILRFIRDPVNYPQYIEEIDDIIRDMSERINNKKDINVELVKELMNSNNVIHSIDTKKHIDNIRKSKKALEIGYSLQRNKTIKEYKQLHLFDRALSDEVRLYSGYVINSAPHRHKISKWVVSLDEYPFSMWPPYVTAGAFILSREALMTMYYVSKFTKHFRFDDIFLGIVAVKSLIEPLHSEYFYFHKAKYLNTDSYKYVVASHGYQNSEEMLNVWLDCKAAGHS